jgi:hypothetical protein
MEGRGFVLLYDMIAFYEIDITAKFNDVEFNAAILIGKIKINHFFLFT